MPNARKGVRVLIDFTLELPEIISEHTQKLFPRFVVFVLVRQSIPWPENFGIDANDSRGHVEAEIQVGHKLRIA